MASNIKSETIDATFPVAGVDNDTQGFRDNFNVIKDSLASAKQEVEDLQTNAAKLNEANNFSGNNIIQANLQAVTQEFFETEGILNSSQNINFDNGHYQSFTVDGSSTPITLTFDNWPADGSNGKLRLELTKSAGSDVYMSFDTLDQNGGTGTVYYGNWPDASGGDIDQLKMDVDNQPYVLEAWTNNGGTTIYLNFVGKFAISEDL